MLDNNERNVIEMIDHEDVKDKRLEGGGKNVKKLIKRCT
jgi:hypothetical protein